MIFAANWKMNLTVDSTKDLFNEYLEATFPEQHKVIVIAPTLALESLTKLSSKYDIKVFAQDVSKFSGFGNFTGETSAEQLKAIGADGVLIGHMERRTSLKEVDEDINLKVTNSLNAGLEVLLSVGESVSGLDTLQQEKLISDQLQKDLQGVSTEQVKGKLVIAYETVDTISSFGKTKSGDALPIGAINNKIQLIKSWLSQNFAAIEIPVLYGGSVAAENINQFSGQKDVGGFLVGKKSLNIDDFTTLLARI